MDQVVVKSVQRAVGTMHDRLGEPLTIDDLARSAMFSKFHFTRVFHKITGVSPGRFLSAVRLDRAKHLLVSTPMSVTDICHHVGYNSVGTFSSQFRSSVGIPPIRYRERGGVVAAPAPYHAAPAAYGVSVRGRVWDPSGAHCGATLVGVFPGRILQAPVVRYEVVDAPGRFSIPDVPAGTWYVLANSSPRCGDATTARCIGVGGPVVISPGVSPRPVDLRLRPMGPFDPPVLMPFGG